MINDYPIFVEYHYYMKQWLKQIMDLDRLHKFNPVPIIPVIYSTPRRAFAMGSSSLGAGDAVDGNLFFALPTQGNNYTPVVAFHYTGATQLWGRHMPYEHVLHKISQDNEYTGTTSTSKPSSVTLTKPLLVYEVTYTASLYTALMQDADILTFRFASEFKPQAQMWIGPQDAIDDHTKGLWAHMVLDSIVDATNYETLDASERTVRKDFNWRITEAYVPTDETVIDSNIIKEVYTDVYLGNG